MYVYIKYVVYIGNSCNEESPFYIYLFSKSCFLLAIINYSRCKTYVTFDEYECHVVFDEIDFISTIYPFDTQLYGNKSF